METRSSGASGQSQTRRNLRQRRFVDILPDERLACVRRQLRKRTIQEQRKLFTLQLNLEIESAFSRREFGAVRRNFVISERDQAQRLTPLPSLP
jgi:hypothetical protein